jgi:protein SCO1/2
MIVEKNDSNPTARTADPSRSRQRGRTAWTLAACAAVVSSLLLISCAREARREPPTLPDVSLIDQHGNSVSLASLKGKVVLLDFIHIGCPGVCSTLVSKFGEVADILKTDLGPNVVLLSVTNDPEHDRPEQLLELARTSAADLKGWLFVTGDPRDVERVIKAFGVNNEKLPDGSPAHITQVFLLDRDGRQRREYRGMLMKPEAVVAQIREVMDQAAGKT